MLGRVSEIRGTNMVRNSPPHCHMLQARQVIRNDGIPRLCPGQSKACPTLWERSSGATGNAATAVLHAMGFPICYLLFCFQRRAGNGEPMRAQKHAHITVSSQAVWPRLLRSWRPSGVQSKVGPCLNNCK